jgi:hypothetical protein
VWAAGGADPRGGLDPPGAEVLVYEGYDISLKGGGGPTCLTRPIARRPGQSPDTSGRPAP